MYKQGFITSEVAKKAIEKYKDIMDSPNFYNWEIAKQVEQRNEEQDLFKNTTFCDKRTFESLKDHVGDLDSDKLLELADTQFYNPNAMKAVQCVIDSVFYNDKYGGTYINNDIRRYFHNLRLIGSESLEGYALLGDFEEAKDMFVIKAPRSPEDDTLLHEMLVGVFGTNRLRKYIPNFAYIYGGFECSPPLVNPKKKEVVTWCLSDSNAVNYVIYENISPSVSASKYISSCTGKEFLAMYMQVLYSLRTALNMIDFTHYDLHSDNVLMRSVNQDESLFQIPYNTERGLEYLTDTGVATIIDYGFSHFKTEQVNGTNGPIPSRELGRYQYSHMSIFAYHSWIMHDLYKFFMFCMMHAQKNNNDSVIKEGEKIFRYFNGKESLPEAISRQWEHRFSFPYLEGTKDMNIDDYSSYIRRVCNCDFLNPERSSIPILQCDEMCIGEQSAYNSLDINGLTTIGSPKDIFEFYTLSMRLYNQGREYERAVMTKKFNYDQAMETHLNEMWKLVDELNSLKSINVINLGNYNISQILNFQVMDNVRNSYVEVAKIVDDIVRLKEYYDVATIVLAFSKDFANIARVESIMDKFNKQVRPTLDAVKAIFIKNHTYLDNIQTDVVVAEAVKRDRRLVWYWSGRSIFDIVFDKVTI